MTKPAPTVNYSATLSLHKDSLLTKWNMHTVQDLTVYIIMYCDVHINMSTYVLQCTH